ncbi:hypothetical protein GBAR_LOCUS28599 [Geodia barretti]|uniref:Uncharacterized protein n=1 Tax=Geodia barretti TaxID=519541 RepID=A0AA35XB66_GEOBA|nr:hypothetical protein GBAR_LOCUS28599 [Geodia barretti]
MQWAGLTLWSHCIAFRNAFDNECGDRESAVLCFTFATLAKCEAHS